MKLVNIEEMRRVEQAADALGHSCAAMMELAGRATAELAVGMGLLEPEGRPLVLVGPGNNGGDGLVAARVLNDAGFDVTVYIWRRDVKGDRSFRLLKGRRRGLAILWADNDPTFEKLRAETGRATLIVDALLGAGAARPIEDQLADLMAAVKETIAERRSAANETEAALLSTLPRFPLVEAHALDLVSPYAAPEHAFDDDPDSDDDLAEEDEDGWDDGDEEEPTDALPWPEAPVLAVDCPSGLNCDTGAVDPAAIPATVTVTFAYPKWGQLQFPGAAGVGLLAVADIGIPSGAAEGLLTDLVEAADVRRLLPVRAPDAHKGTFGRVLIAGGSLSFPGAVILAGRAAGRAGAGLVSLAAPAALHPALASALPEATWLPLPESDGALSADGAARLIAGLAGYDALLIGPGLTTAGGARAFVERLLSPEGLPREAWEGRLVVDADALNVLAGLPDWPGRLPPSSILTPHPGEMARLIGATPDEVNAERIALARRCAGRWGHIVVLKGPHTVVAAPDGRAAVLPFATAALATAGSGDALAGAIAAMRAQGTPAFEATTAAAYLHGAAGYLLARSAGASGILATDIIERFPTVLRALYAAHPRPFSAA